MFFLFYEKRTRLSRRLIRQFASADTVWLVVQIRSLICHSDPYGEESPVIQSDEILHGACPEVETNGPVLSKANGFRLVLERSRRNDKRVGFSLD